MFYNVINQRDSWSLFMMVKIPFFLCDS